MEKITKKEIKKHREITDNGMIGLEVEWKKHNNNLALLDCPICKSNHAKSLHKENIVYDGFWYSYNYSLCKICGFVWQQHRHERSHYEKLPCQFPDDYDEHTFRRAAYIFNFCWSDRVECSSFIKSTTSILDIGCGPGGVMKNLKKIFYNADVTGYTLDVGEPQLTDLKIHFRNIEDANDIRVLNTKEKMELEALRQLQSDHSRWLQLEECNRISELTHPLKRYDLIIMSHVVEHLYDLHAAMKNIHNLLTDDGLFYIEVPSFHWCEVRTSTVWWPEHLSFFTKRSLSNLLTMNGFQIIKIKESRYWGNIKVLVRKSQGYTVDKNFVYNYFFGTMERYADEIWKTNEAGWWTMIKHRLAKASYPYYRLKRWLFNPGANE